MHGVLGKQGVIGSRRRHVCILALSRNDCSTMFSRGQAPMSPPSSGVGGSDIANCKGRIPTYGRMMAFFREPDQC